MSERYPDESDRSNSSFKEARNKMKERVEYKKNEKHEKEIKLNIFNRGKTKRRERGYMKEKIG